MYWVYKKSKKLIYGTVLSTFVLATVFMSVKLAGAADKIQVEGGTDITTLSAFLERLINVICIEILGIACFITFIVAGFTYMSAGADATKVEKAKKMITYGVLGLILGATSWLIFSIVIHIISNIFS